MPHRHPHDDGTPDVPVRTAILTISDTRGPGDDPSGDLAAKLLEAAGHPVAERAWVPDEIRRIRETVEPWLERDDIQAILCVGGTGLAPRDCTVEALAPRFEKTLEGFGELFRYLSYQDIGAAAMLSRAAAGIQNGCALFLLPGSPGAVSLAVERLILPEIHHLLRIVRS